MNVVVNSQTLAAELRLLNKVVPTKPALAVLSHALFQAGEGLHMWATDLEVGLNTSCQATVNEPGMAALPVAKFLSLVEQFADGDVVLASDKQHVTVACGAFKSRLQTLPAADFPQAPVVEGTTSTIDGDVLKGLIERTRYAINASVTKYTLKGALLILNDKGAAMVTTDGKRLALTSGNRTGPDAQFIVPTKALDMLTSHLADTCDVTVGASHLFFVSGGRLLTSRTIDGQFPAYQRIIPKENTRIVTVDRTALSSALRRVNLVAEDSAAVYFDVAQGQMTLSASSAEVGSADEVVMVAYEGDPMKVCINGRYVLDFLNVAVNDAVTLALRDPNTAMLLSDGESHIAVIMPMKG